MMRLISYLFLGIILLGCNENNKQSRKDKIEQEVVRKTTRYRSILKKRCEKDLLAEAQTFVDSLVLNEMNVLDTVSSPPRPKRPSIEKKIILNDSTKIEPIKILK